MHIETRTKDLSKLLDLYNREIDALKAKLLNGVPWEEMETTRKNITELAVAIHKSHAGKKVHNEVYAIEADTIEVA